MYARKSGERELTFDFADGLVKDNLLIVDRETGSLWSQLAAKAVSGPLEGTPLAALPSIQTTWKHWREMHPDTRVMVVKGSQGEPYIYRSTELGRPSPEKRHDTAALGLGLVVDGEAIYFPFTELDRAPSPLRLRVGGRPVVVRYRKDALTSWAEDEQGNLLVGVLAYRNGWKAFHPETKFYRAGHS